MFNYDKAIADPSNHVLPNINQFYCEDDYGDVALLDWQGACIHSEDRVYIVKYKKTIDSLISGLIADKFLITYLATDESLVDLFDEKDTGLYWSMEITTGKDLME